MHDQMRQLPKDFLPFDDAIKLIQAETREDPKIDISFMAHNIQLGTILPRHTFQIPLLGLNGKKHRIERVGIRYVYLNNEYEATILEHTITQKYEELARKGLEPSIRKATSVVNDTDNTLGVLLNDVDSSRNVGDDI